MSAPSGWQLERAMSALTSVRQRLLQDDPDMALDETLMHDMLEGESGDALDVLDRVVRASIAAAGLAEEAEARAKAIAGRGARFKARSQHLRDAAFAALSALELKSHERADFLVTIRAGRPSVVITDEAAIPHAFTRTTTTPDKTLIAAALKAGQAVPGADMSNASPVLSIRTT